jgi:hypothetical protein
MSTAHLNFVRADAACSIADVRRDCGGGSIGFGLGLSTQGLCFRVLGNCCDVYSFASVAVAFSRVYLIKTSFISLLQHI